jgi:hypothetical protein
MEKVLQVLFLILPSGREYKCSKLMQEVSSTQELILLLVILMIFGFLFLMVFAAWTGHPKKIKQWVNKIIRTKGCP